MAEPLEAVATGPVAEEPLASSPLAPPSPTAEEPTLAGSFVAAPELPAAPALDLAELDRRTEATATPFPPGALDDFDPRVDATMEVPVVRRVSSEPTPAEEPVQPTLRLDDPGEAPDAAGDPAAPGYSPPAEPAVEHRARRVGLASLLGMLLIGFLLGIPAGYLMAPKASPEPALSGVKPALPAPPEGAAGQPAAAPASAVPAPQPPTSDTPTPTPPVKAAATPPPAAAVAATPVKKAAPPAAPRQPAKSDAARGAAAAATAGQPATARKTAPTTHATFQGGLVIVSRPDGASVSIDGRPVGTTPLTMQALTAGSHAVRLELAGYSVWTSGVQVTAGKVNRVTASLERRPGG